MKDRFTSAEWRQSQGLPAPGADKHENRTSPQLPNSQSSKPASPLGRDHAGEAQGTGRPHVCFVLCRVKLLDVDAKYGSIKDLLDGLQYAGLIRGDREDQITLEVTQQKVSHYFEEKTLINIDLP